MKINKKDLDAIGCFNFAAAAVAQAFAPIVHPGGLSPRQKYNDLRKKRSIRLRFLQSKFAAISCDCTDNFERTKLINSFKRKFYARPKN